MGQDHEHVNQSKGGGRDDEEVAGGDLASVIPKEGEPSLAVARLPASRHILRDGGLREIMPDLIPVF